MTGCARFGPCSFCRYHNGGVVAPCALDAAALGPLSVAAIAEVLGVRRQTVHETIDIALAKLRRTALRRLV